MSNIKNSETKIYVANAQYLMSNNKNNLNVFYNNNPNKIEALIVGLILLALLEMYFIRMQYQFQMVILQCM